MSIVNALRFVQEAYGYLPDDALLALAKRMQIKPHRLQEVASFFPHFLRQPPPDVVVRVCRDMSCHLAGAREMVAELKQMPEAKDKGSLVIETVSCLGRCDRAPVACIERAKSMAERPDPDQVASRAALADNEQVSHFDFWCRHGQQSLGEYLSSVKHHVSALVAGDQKPQFDGDESHDVATNQWLIDIYQTGDASHAAAEKLLPFAAAQRFAKALHQDGVLEDCSRQIRPSVPRPGAKDFAGLEGFLNGNYPPSICNMLREVDKSVLRGMGGAGQTAFSKLVDVMTAPGSVRYVVANGDESEPGTFKDRELFLRAPHLVVEGVILAGLLLGAERGYIYVRHEYAEGIAKLVDAIRTAESSGVCGKKVLGTSRTFPVEVFVSPGGYICGEQSALIEAMEDKRAEPRNRPPELATNGLRNQPTLVNNVETLAWYPAIFHFGGTWYIEQGVGGCKGRRFFSISGDVAKPGVYELPIGTPLRTLVFECAGGMRDPEKPLKTIATSGPSSGFVPLKWTDEKGKEIDVLDVPLDIDAFRARKLMLGAGLVVYDESRDLVEQAVNCTEFFRKESCGKCVPCRIGTEKLVQIGNRILNTGLDEEDLKVQREVVDQLSLAMEYSSVCGLGMVAFSPLSSVLRNFPGDVQSHTWG